VSAAIARCAAADEAVRVVRNLIESKLANLQRETNLHRRGLDEIESLEDRFVLVRVDANVDLREGSVAIERRVMQMVPTLECILERGATPIVCSHLGDPGAALDAKLSREEIYRDYSLGPVAEVLGSRFGGSLVFHETSIASSGLLVTRKNIVPGAVNLLENLRFATGEKDNDEAFARSLAELSDGWFVNDAFNVCHRRHASITGVPKFVEHRLAGPMVARELSVLETLLDEPERPFVAVFGGGELEAQFGVMAALLPRVDSLAILAAEARSEPQATASMIKALREAYPEKVIVAGSNESAGGGLSRLVRALDEACTILWSGPAGLAEYDARRDRPRGPSRPIPAEALHRAMRRAAFTVVCSEGEKQLAGLGAPGFHLSAGPRAFLEYLERLSLPGITALDPSGR
jgi:phosphoglycerate kinase